MQKQCDKELLELVAENSNAGTIRNLLSKGINPNIENSKKQSAIILAVLNKNEEIIRLLLENGAEINFKDSTQKTALHWASGRRSYGSIVRILLENGANPNLSDKSGMTPLCIAARKGEKTYVELMLNYILTFKNPHPYDFVKPIELSIQKGYLDIFILLFKFIKTVDIEHDYVDVALKEASSCGQLDVVQIILEGDETVTQYIGDFTPLIQAARRGHLHIVEILINFGFIPDLLGYEGKTALIYAAINGNTSIVKYLIDKNSDINIADRNGETALILAIKEGNLEVTKCLLENGADFYKASKDKYGHSLNPLMWSAKKKDEKLMLALLQIGVNPNIKNEYGDSAVFIAIEDNRWRSTITELYDKQYDIDGNYVRIIDMFIEHGLDINIQDGQGMTLLMWAVVNKYIKVFELLISKGADVTIKCERGKTAIDYASERYGTETMVEMLS